MTFEVFSTMSFIIWTQQLLSSSRKALFVSVETLDKIASFLEHSHSVSKG